jgi:hypothetical protein
VGHSQSWSVSFDSTCFSLEQNDVQFVDFWHFSTFKDMPVPKRIALVASMMVLSHSSHVEVAGERKVAEDQRYCFWIALCAYQAVKRYSGALIPIQ